MANLEWRARRAESQLHELHERLRSSAPDACAGLEGLLSQLAKELEALRADAQRVEPTLALLQLVVTTRDSDEMVRRAVSYLKEWSGVDAVGIRLREGEDFPYFATSGFSDGFVAAETSLLALDRDGRPARDAQGRVELECVCGRVIRGELGHASTFLSPRGTFWTNSTSELLRTATEEDLHGPTRNHCHAAGYESVALIPLRQGAETFGLVQLNDHATERFSPDRIALLEEIADYLAAALS